MKLGESQLLIEIWSDVVCPWCYIGKHNLETALAVFEDRDSVTILHRAFRLDPQAHQTRSSLDSLGEKYGLSQARAMMERVSDTAAGVGLTFRLEETMTGNTLDAHRLLLWAQIQGDAQPLLEVLYHAYFGEAQSVFDRENLIRLATSAGYSPDEVQSLLESDAFAAEVESDQSLAASLGANGVPFFVIDRKYGISGAQPIETFSKVLDQAAQARA
jgi:predicted DsbA family dithiol-disulfide isomerase